ncbi:MAG: RNA methyltransferase [Synechococcales cyanobacterium]
MILTSPKNPLIRQWRLLHTAKGRREQGLFLIEGTHLLQEALATQWPLQAVCFTPAWAERHPHLLINLAPTLSTYTVSPEVLQALATTTTPDGVLAIAQRRDLSVPFPQFELGIALETLQDPGNVGTIIRTAVAAQADGIWLTADSVDRDHPKLLRASAGQWFRLPPRELRDPQDLFSYCRQQGIQILATTVDQAQPFWDVDLCRPSLLLMGNEGAGLSSPWIAAADQRISIPMAASVESLNVAMSVGLILYEAQRQRRQAGIPTI